MDTSSTSSPPPVVKAKPLVGLFLAQPAGLVGKDKPFQTIFELCKWAHEVCGFEAVSAPPSKPFVDVERALENAQYRADLLGKYSECGTPLKRFENHCGGQRMLLHPAQLPKFRGFASPQFRSANHRTHELIAEKETLRAVEITHLFGFRHLVDFSGNRGWCVAKYPWNAYPKEFLLHVLLLVLLKHRKVLARCAELGIIRCFELHPESDIYSPWLLYLFRELAKIVAPETVPAIGANYDASHPTLAKDSAGQHALFLLAVGLLFACHLKDGEVRDAQNFLNLTSGATDVPLWVRGGSIHGDFAPRWSGSLRRFCTVGTGQAPWDVIGPVLQQAHSANPHGLALFVEAECSRYPNMMQGIKIGAENARRIRDSQPLLEQDEIKVEAPIGSVDWEAFCQTDYTAAELLCLNDRERKNVRAMIKQVGTSDILRFF